MTSGLFGSILNSKSGTTLAELMITLAIVSIVGLGTASGYIFAVTQFSLLQDENETETSLLQAAYFLRLFVNQAVKTQCIGGGLGPAVVLGFTSGTPTIPPAGVFDGQIDCRIGTLFPPAAPAGRIAWPVGAPSALGVFLRENGPDPANPPPTSVSLFQGVGVYFQAADPTTVNSSGVLTFSQQQGPSVGSTTGAVNFYHFTDIQIVNFSTTPVNVGGVTYNMLQTISYLIGARYFRASGPKIYDPNVGCNNPLNTTTLCRDVTMQVDIGLHDNFLGTDLTSNQTAGNQTNEHLNGGVYFYKFLAPTNF